jgi:hypothetical protein
LLLREATQIFGHAGITVSRLLALVQAGKITARLANPERRLHGLAVARHDVESVLPEARQRQQELQGYPVHRLAKTLFPGRQTKADVLKKWIDRGILQAQQVGRARMVMPDEISRFHLTYCLREEAARLLGISSNTLSSWVRAGRVLPAYPPRGQGGLSLYRRADIELLRGFPRRRAAA